MRKMVIFLVVVLLLVTAGCGAKAPETGEIADETTIPATETPTEVPTEVPTEAPTEPGPECEDALVQVDQAPAILMLLNRGDKVDVVGEYDQDHYIIKTERGYGLVEKQLLRLEGETAYTGWTGYAYSNAAIYSNYQLTGEPSRKLNLNTKIQIIEELSYAYLVQIDEVSGFMRKAEVSKDYINYSNGNGNSGGADGGDISLSFGGIVMLAAIEQSGEIIGAAEVLVDNAQVILGYYSRGDTVPVVSVEGFAPVWEGYHALYINGIYAYIPETFVKEEGEEDYVQWDGFAGYNAYLYDNYLMQGEGKRLNVNTAVTVIWDGGDYYVVSVNEAIGYISVSEVGQNRYATGGGGESGGDWTPPAL